MSSRCGHRLDLGLVVVGAGQGAEELSGDVALEAASDSSLAESLAGASLDVGLSVGVAFHPGSGDRVQGPVELPVAAGVEAVVGGLARFDLDRADAAELGQRGLVVD